VLRLLRILRISAKRPDGCLRTRAVTTRDGDDGGDRIVWRRRSWVRAATASGTGDRVFT
jgi:hypothetical protein